MLTVAEMIWDRLPQAKGEFQSVHNEGNTLDDDDELGGLANENPLILSSMIGIFDRCYASIETHLLLSSNLRIPEAHMIRWRWLSARRAAVRISENEAFEAFIELRDICRVHGTAVVLPHWCYRSNLVLLRTEYLQTR